MRKPGFILQLKIDIDLAIRRTGQVPFPSESLIVESRELIHAEVRIDRIDADYRREFCGISLYQVADIHQLAADASIDRRCNFGTLDIMLTPIFRPSRALTYALFPPR